MENKNVIQRAAKHQRNWFGKWHTWAGITAGFVLILVSLTGSLLVFEQELDVYFYPELFDFEPTADEPMTFEQALLLVQREMPEISARGVYQQKDRANAVMLYSDEEPYPQIIIDPYRGEIRGTRVYKNTIMGFIRNFHRTLLIPAAGRYIVGISSLVCVILMITGLRLWIPKKWKEWKHLKARMSVKWDGSRKRVNFDLHNTLGFFFAPFITLIALTGVMITFSTVVIGVLFLLNFRPPEDVAKLLNQQSTYVADVRTLTVPEVERIVQELYPEATITGINIPKDSLAAFSVNMNIESTMRTGDVSFVSIDQYSGEKIFSSNDPLYKMGKAYTNWVTPLHYGTFGGLKTRIIALLASLVNAALFITGFIIWIPRWRKQQKSRAKAAAKAAEKSKLQNA